MDIVLGVSLAPDSVRMVLLQGENAEGATVDEKEFAVAAADDSPTVSTSDRAIAAILGTREDAAGAGIELCAVGVACTDRLEAKAVRDALAAHKLENVMLVSTFLAATSLTQSVGGAMGYERTAVLFVEPDTATLAVVETSDGSVADVQKEQLNSASGEIATAKLIEMVAGLVELPDGPDGLFVVGSGVDLAPIKPALEDATPLSVSMPEEPETALARGAALASANAPLFASSTAALAYAQDPGTGAHASALPEYLRIAGAEPGDDELAYSAVDDDEASAPTVVMHAGGRVESQPRPRPGLLVGSAVAVAAISAAMALEIALSVGVHTTVGLLPAPLQNLIAPAEHVFAPAPWQVAATKAAAPKPLSPLAGVPPAAPVPVVAAAPVPAAAVPPAPVPAPAVPIPMVVAPIAPPPLPPVWLSDLPASPPVVQAPPHPSPPAEPPPVHVPPPHSPPPHQTPPGQGPGADPGSTGGRPPSDPGDGVPVNGPGPSHGNPGSTPPESGGPATGPGATHGTPGGTPPEGGGPVGGGTPLGGGPVGGGESHAGGPVSGSVGGGGSPVGGGSSLGGGGSIGGGSSLGGGSSPGGGSSGGGGSSTGGGSSGGGGHH